MRPSTAARLFAGLIAAAALLSLAGDRQAAPVAAAPALSVTKIDVASQNPPRISAHVTVAQPNRIPIAGLTPDRFHVNVDGQPVKSLDVQSAPNSSGTIAVAVALDTSGSMQGAKLAAAQDAGRGFVSLLAPQDLLAFITFGGTSVRTLVPLSTDRGPVLQAIDGLTADGSTPLWDAVDRAITTVLARNDGPRTVLVATDGGDEPADPRSSLSLDTVIARAQQNGVPVFTVGIGQDVLRDPLQKLANDTGGQYLDSPSPDQLKSTFHDVASLLRLEYVLSFDGEPLNKDTDHTLEVGVNVDGQSGIDSHRYTVPAVVAPHVAVTLTAPANGSQASADVPISAEVTPQMSVQGVRFLVDGNPVGTASAPPYAATWQVKGATTGDHTVRVEATGADGQVVAQQATVHYIDPHVTMRLVSPGANQHLSGATRIEADVNPVPSVRGVRFLVDGKEIGTATAPPFAVNWSAKSVLIGAHQLRVDATGADGQTATAIDNVTVVTPANNATPLIAGAGGIAAVLAIVLAAMLISRSRRRQVAVFAAAGFAGAAAGGSGPPPPAGATGLLTEVVPGGTGREWPLSAAGLIVGRDVPPGNIMLDDPDVSRSHARIYGAGAVLVWEDLGPTNPSRINGVPYTAPHALADGDEIAIGNIRLAFFSRRPA